MPTLVALSGASVILRVVAIAVLLAASGGERAVAQATLFGFNEGYQLYEGAQLRAAVADSREGGATVARFPLAWAGVEPEPGRFDWARYDAVHGELLAQGIRSLPVIVDSPWWARPGRPRLEVEGHAAQYPARSFEAEWERFAGAVAERYPASVAIEVWNEPNSAHFWGGPPDPRRYTELLAGAYRAIKRIDPAMPVLLAGPAPRIGTPLQWDRFLRRVYAHGAARVSDGLSLHPYAHRPGEGLSEIVEQVRQAEELVRARHPGATVWVTEVGFSSHPEARNPVSELRQARLLRDVYVGLRGRQVAAILVHRLREVDTSNPTENGYGVTRIDGERKPAFCILVALNASPRFC